MTLAILITASVPASIGFLTIPKVNVDAIPPTEFITPRVTTAAANPTIAAPVPIAHLNPGYLVYDPVDIILSVATIVPAIAMTANRPAAIAIAPSPAVAVIIVPNSKAARPNAIIVNPTPNAHFKVGYLSYLPRFKMSEDTIIAVAIATMTNPPWTISFRLTFEIAFITFATTKVVKINAIDNNANLTIFPKEISGILLIRYPAATILVVIATMINPAFKTSFLLIPLIALTIIFNAKAKATNNIAIPIPVKN